MRIRHESLEVVHIEWLVHNTIRAPVHGALDHFRSAGGGHEHDRGVRHTTPHFFEKAQVVRVGQAVVEQHDVDSFRRAVHRCSGGGGTRRFE